MDLIAKGIAIEIVVPFEGDVEAFDIQPTTFTLNPPLGDVRDGSLTLTIEGTDLTADQVRAKVDRTLAEIQGCLTTLRGNAQGLNDQVRSLARGAIEERWGTCPETTFPGLPGMVTVHDICGL